MNFLIKKLNIDLKQSARNLKIQNIANRIKNGSNHKKNNLWLLASTKNSTHEFCM